MAEKDPIDQFFNDLADAPEKPDPEPDYPSSDDEPCECVHDMPGHHRCCPHHPSKRKRGQ